MTDRLYYHDSYLREFRGRVVDTAEEGRRVYLDRTAFYPSSGGQPFDVGTLSGVAVREVIDEEDRIAHLLESPLGEADVEGQIDWTRRFDHMQQHTGQHLLSAVLLELFGIPTLSFHMGAVSSNIEIGVDELSPSRLDRVEDRCAGIIAEARPVTVSFEDSTAGLGLRKPSDRAGTLRIVSIAGLDRSACGGTHLKTTAEIGPLFLRKLEKIRGNTRLDFVCGSRAYAHARQDFRTLSEISRLVSVPFEEAPAQIAALIEKSKSLEKSAQKTAAELAQREGRELYAAAVPDAEGVRRITQRGPIDEVMRARAQAFTAGSKAIFLAVCENPPSILLAASPDAGIRAGDRVKAAVTAAGGRGGGNPALAQGSVPSAAALEEVAKALAGY
ncbi:MAG TPA: DHHA1 domain-containing protein [Bryobacteraceae bacterium]|nr:DHHA1 domain-containing protein [Bryobacteraceae bacterium]